MTVAGTKIEVGYCKQDRRAFVEINDGHTALNVHLTRAGVKKLIKSLEGIKYETKS